jgi:hypothetical protein
MNLLQLRQQFRTISGRFDLVNEDGSDVSANFYINAGQRHLDRLVETQKSWGICYRFCDANFYSVQFPYCRAVKEVWAATTTARWKLEKKDLQYIISNYLTTLPSGIDSGTPLYYAPAITRSVPETSKIPSSEFESFVGYVDIISADHFAYNSIIITPPPSEKLLVEIKGLFYSGELTLDDDKSYWSEVHSDILIMAAMRHLEVVNRNTQGVNDWSNAILTEISGIGKDFIEEEITDIDQIEG